MELLTAGINALVVAAVGLVLAWLGKGRFDMVDRRLDALDQKVDRLGDRLDGRIDRVEDRMERFQGSLDSMRSDLTQVALVVGVRPRASNT